MFATYLPTLIGTLLVELLIIGLIAPKPQRKTCLLTALFANLLTHSLATLAALYGDAAMSFGIIEFAVVGTELLAFRFVAGLSLWRAARLSLIANTATIALAIGFLS